MKNKEPRDLAQDVAPQNITLRVKYKLPFIEPSVSSVHCIIRDREAHIESQHEKIHLVSMI